jgi:ABC-type branched-subunit amino acid transport system permease subunit
MEKLAEKVNLLICLLLVVITALGFIASIITLHILPGIFFGILTWAAINILKITIDEQN